jgi:hypothetical protein
MITNNHSPPTSKWVKHFFEAGGREVGWYVLQCRFCCTFLLISGSTCDSDSSVFFITRSKGTRKKTQSTKIKFSKFLMIFAIKKKTSLHPQTLTFR